MVEFIFLGLSGGVLLSGLATIYFKFAFSNLSKYEGAVWAFGGLFTMVGIMFIFFPLSSFCVHSILKQDTHDAVSNLRLFWLAPFLINWFYWVIKIAKKQDELRKKSPPKPEGPNKINWF